MTSEEFQGVRVGVRQFIDYACKGWSPEDKEDMEQQAMMTAVMYQHTYNPEKSALNTWGYNVARGAYIRERKKATANKRQCNGIEQGLAYDKADTHAYVEQDTLYETKTALDVDAETLYNMAKETAGSSNESDHSFLKKVREHLWPYSRAEASYITKAIVDRRHCDQALTTSSILPENQPT